MTPPIDLMTAWANTSPQEWTAYGLLATVLAAIGTFLGWYIPTHDRNTRERVESQQARFEARIANQQQSFSDTLVQIQQQHRLQAEREQAVFAESLQAERRHHRELLDRVCREFQCVNTSTVEALAEVRDTLAMLTVHFFEDDPHAPFPTSKPSRPFRRGYPDDAAHRSRPSHAP